MHNARIERVANLIDGTFQASSMFRRPTFLLWLKEFTIFIETRHCVRLNLETGVEEPELVLLHLDQHSSHLTIEALELAEKANFIIFGLVAHAHNQQPLDVACFRTWHSSYSKELWRARKPNPTLVVKKVEFPRLMRPAWEQALCLANTIADLVKRRGSAR